MGARENCHKMTDDTKRMVSISAFVTACCVEIGGQCGVFEEL